MAHCTVQWWAKAKQSLSIEHSIKYGFSLKGDNAEPYGTNKTPLTAGDISRGAVVRSGFSFHSRREECNSSQSSDNNVNVWREVNRRHDVDAWRFHTVQTSHWIWPGNYWSVSKLYYQVLKFPLGGLVEWFGLAHLSLWTGLSVWRTFRVGPEKAIPWLTLGGADWKPEEVENCRPFMGKC